MSKFQYQNGDRPLDGYTIEYALGRGGFGEVYYAVSDAGRQVALKAVQNYEEIELRGISHCMNLKSQHLVSIFDVKNGDNGTPWVIMEFVAGPSLRDILDDAPQGIGTEQACFFLRELAKGLTYLHGAGVVHRDLKPHNVFFEEGVVKIGDYSLSKVITTSHRSGHTMTVGTVHYMAPEISMGRYDKTVDIYALGVMLYEMLTGSPPFTGDSMGEVLMKHLSAQPDVSGLPEPFASVVTKAMQREPANRYQSTEEMAAELLGLDQAADSMTGFGAASLSMVADRAARRVRPASEDSTGRVDAALVTTQREAPAQTSESVHPMRQLGRDLGGIAFHAAMVGRPKDLGRSATAPDPIAPFWRVVLAAITLIAMPLVGATLSEFVGTSTSTTLISGSLGPFGSSEDSLAMPGRFIENTFRILVPSIAILVAAMLTRKLISRNSIPDWPTSCRLLQVVFSFALVALILLLRISPVTQLHVVNLLPVALVMLIQNWSLLTSPTRPQRMRLCPVLFAATIAFLTGEVLGADSMLVVAIACGGVLSIQAWSQFSPSIPVPTQIMRPNYEPGPRESDVASKPTMNALVTME